MNHLYLGDCLDVLPLHFAEGSIHVCYIDPPYYSQRHYGAFSDVWVWNAQAECERDLLTGLAARLIDCFVISLGKKGMLAYLVAMGVRLQQIWRVLTPTGSLWLQCDGSASAYLKMMLDAVFGWENGADIICWKRTTAKGCATRHLGKCSDTLFRYCKGGVDAATWNASMPASNMPYDFTDIWLDIKPVAAQSKERFHAYPTQKPIALLERVIGASSNVGDTVLDCFCGGGTTPVAAQGMGRNWVGIDLGEQSITTTLSRLETVFGLGVKQSVVVHRAPTGSPAGGCNAECQSGKEAAPCP